MIRELVLAFDHAARAWYRAWHRDEHERSLHALRLDAPDPLGILPARDPGPFPLEAEPPYLLALQIEAHEETIAKLEETIAKLEAVAVKH